jgi:hypothetical protein
LNPHAQTGLTRQQVVDLNFPTARGCFGASQFGDQLRLDQLEPGTRHELSYGVVQKVGGGSSFVGLWPSILAWIMALRRVFRVSKPRIFPDVDLHPM